MPAVACPDSGHLHNKAHLFFSWFFTSLRDILAFPWSKTLLSKNDAAKTKKLTAYDNGEMCR